MVVVVALDAQTLALAKQGAGKKHQFRSPSEQAAIEAARAAGTPGFRAPSAPPANGLAPSSMFRLPPAPRAKSRVQGGVFRSGGKSHRLYGGQYGNPGRAVTYNSPSIKSGTRGKTAGGKKLKGYKKIAVTETGIYGRGGEAGWLKRWYQGLRDMGLPAMTPLEFKKWAGYDDRSAAWRGGLQEMLRTFKDPAAQHDLRRYGGLAGSTVKDMDTSRFTSEEALKFFAERATGRKFKDMAEVNRALQPAGSFSDTMWRRYLAGGGADFGALSGPGGESAVPDFMLPYFALRNFGDYGAAGPADSKFGFTNAGLMSLFKAAKNPKKAETLKAALTKVQSEMPDWVPRAYETLQGLPMTKDFRGGADQLFQTLWSRIAQMGSLPQVNGMDGSVNLTNPALPFVSPTAVGGGTLAGDDSMARYVASLSPYEWFTEIGPLMAHMEATTGTDKQYKPATEWQWSGAGSEKNNPYYALPSYQRFMAYGNLDPEAARKDWRNQFGFDPFQQQGWGDWTNKVPTKNRGYSWEYAKALGVPYTVWLFGAETPQHYQDTYWANNRAPYAPWNLDADTLARMRRIVGVYT